MDGATQSWIIYSMRLPMQAECMNAVCSQREWERMEATRPGHHTLIQAGFATEADAEKAARGTSGDTPKRVPKTGGAAGHAEHVRSGGASAVI